MEDDEEFDWQIDQEVPVEEKPVGTHCDTCCFNHIIQLHRSCLWANTCRIMDLLSSKLQCLPSSRYDYDIYLLRRCEVNGCLPQHELPALVDCPDPDNMTSHERRVARLAHEEASFNPEHYL